jgi:hypothetical protein
MPGHVGVDVDAASLEERSDAVTVSRRQHREPSQAGAAQDTHEDRLRPVIGVMARSDAVSPHPVRRFTQGSPARFTSARFEVATSFDDDAGPLEGHVERTGKHRDPVEFSSALDAETVVDAMGEETETGSASKASQYVEKGNGIRSTAHRGEHTGS